MTYVTGLRCPYCGAEFPDEARFEGCPSCRTDEFAANLVPVYDYEGIEAAVDPATLLDRRPGVWSYPELLPVDAEEAVTLGEGGTPLVEAPSLGERFGVSNLYLKDESQNPTWSFKDRLCSVAVAKGRELGADVVTISSTGNHGAATAAYAARAGLDCVVFTLTSVPQTMKVLMQVYGASVVQARTHEDRWTAMKKCIERFGWYPTGNYVYPPVGSNLYGIEGYKTIAYEIVSDLGEVPDYVVQPTAYADGLHGIYRGFEDLVALGVTDRTPRMVAVEPFGPLGKAQERGSDRVESVESDDTIAFSIGVDVSTYQGLHALRASDGTTVRSDDADLRSLQRELGRTTGVYAEASSVAALVGVRELAERGAVDADDTVVAMHTSTGLKDTGMTAEELPPVPTIDPTLDSVREALATEYGLELDAA